MIIIGSVIAGFVGTAVSAGGLGLGTTAMCTAAGLGAVGLKAAAKSTAETTARSVVKKVVTKKVASTAKHKIEEMICDDEDDDE